MNTGTHPLLVAAAVQGGAQFSCGGFAWWRLLDQHGCESANNTDRRRACWLHMGDQGERVDDRISPGVHPDGDHAKGLFGTQAEVAQCATAIGERLMPTEDDLDERGGRPVLGPIGRGNRLSPRPP